MPIEVVPTLTPVPGSSGTILYLQQDDRRNLLYRLPVDSDGVAVGSPVPIEASERLANNYSRLYEIHPSPDRKFAALVTAVETGAQVGLYKFDTGQVIGLLREHTAAFGSTGRFLAWSPDSLDPSYIGLVLGLMQESGWLIFTMVLTDLSLNLKLVMGVFSPLMELMSF